MPAGRHDYEVCMIGHEYKREYSEAVPSPEREQLRDSRVRSNAGQEELRTMTARRDEVRCFAQVFVMRAP
jgi:hypothetical protein